MGSALAWQPSTAWHWLLVNLVGALAYWLFSKLGVFADIGPAGVSVLWPPNGLALALVMAWGPRVLPGLILGALAPESMLAMVEGKDALNDLGVALLVRLGSAGQWWAMYLMVGDWRGQLDRAGARFALRYVLCTLVACLLAPTVGMATLLSVGQVTQGELASGWIAWWVGDTAGMLVVTPLLLAALHPLMRQHLITNQTFPTMAIGLGLTLAGTASLGDLDRMARQDRAAAELRSFAQSLGNLMSLAEADLARLAAVHYRNRLEEAEFERQSASMRRERSWVSGYAYLRLLPAAERSAFEDNLEQTVRSIGADGSLNRAPEQSSYWVVERLSPMGGQETRLGVDEGSEPRRRQAIQAALSNQSAAATDVLDDLLYAHGDEWGVLLYAPVFESEQLRGDGAPATGVVSATVKLEALVRAALDQNPSLEFNTLLNPRGQRSRSLLLDGKQAEWVGSETTSQWLSDTPSRDQLRQQVKVGNTEWHLYSRFARSSAWPKPSWTQWASLAIGLGSTALLTALLIARSRRDEVLSRWREDLSREVSARTEELSELNKQLQAEAQQREAMAQQLLATSQQTLQRETLLSALLRHIPDPVWLLDVQGRYLIVNEALERFLGRTAQELIGAPASQFISAVHAARAADKDRRALMQRECLFEEAEVRDAQGRDLIHAQIRVAVRGERGLLLGILGLSWDITDQRRREYVLQRFQLLADSAAQGFALTDLRGRILYLNATSQRWLAEDQWVEGSPRHAQRYAPPETWARLKSELMPELLLQGSWTGLLPLRNRRGESLDALLCSFSLLRGKDGQPQYVSAVFTDLSERLALEEQLASARDKAEQANQAKSTFLSNMSHEIRTPLNAVLGYAQLLNEDPDLGTTAKTQVESIRLAGIRLLRLINDVLDLAKIEAGALQLKPEPCDLHSELLELHRLLKPRAEQSLLGFELELLFDGPLSVQLDRGKLGQVLLNLLGNAIKFTPPDGRVLLHARLEEGDTLCVRVEDTGAGIAQAELNELFQPFRQGSGGARHGGTGLGLALARKLTEAMGGELWLESTPGKGTRAHVRLPLQRLTQALERAAPEEFSEGSWQLEPNSRCRVLVAEDDPDSRQLLVALLRRIGCEVGVGEDGRQALQLAEKQDFDLVLSDIRMPVMDGLALRIALKSLPHASGWPVVAITASSLALTREDFLAQGFTDYIAKPYAFAEVLRALRNHGGARLQRRDAPEPTATPTARNDGVLQADELNQAVQWAQEGRALELRQWLDLKPALPPEALDAVRAALARYDLQSVEAVLQAQRRT